MEPPIRRGDEAGEKALGLLRGGEGRAVEHQIFFRPFQRLDTGLRENMHVVRPLHSQIGTAGAVPVMVAGGDIDLRGHLPQRGGQTFRRVPIGVGAVKKVTGKQHQLNAVLVDVVGKTHRQVTAFPAAGGGLLGRQRGKGAVKMKVRRVNEFQHGPSLSVLLFLGTPTLCNVNPAHKVGGIFFQLVTGQLNGAVAAAGGGEHGIEPLQGDV